MNTDEIPTQDERIMAALAHGAILLPFWGLVLSGLIWTTQREKSEYVRRQGAQAMGWQVGQIVAWFVGMGCYFVSFFFMFLTVFLAEATNSPPFFLPVIPFLSFAFLLLLTLAFIVVGVVAAVRVLQGRTFIYPFIGRRIEAYLAGE